MKTKEKELIIDANLTIEKIEELKNSVLSFLKKDNLENLYVTSKEIDLTGIQLIISIKKFAEKNNKKIKLELEKNLIDKLKLYGFEILSN